MVRPSRAASPRAAVSLCNQAAPPLLSKSMLAVRQARGARPISRSVPLAEHSLDVRRKLALTDVSATGRDAASGNGPNALVAEL